MTASLNKMPDSLAQWLARIENFHPEEIELGLDRIKQVFHCLGLASFKAPVVIFAGTNGKGSTLGLLEQAAVHQGVRVVSYTSPHIITFNERIRILGLPVEDTLLCEAFSKIEAARQKIPLTYFEFTTLAAFLIIQQQSPELILLEVGLGGRFDAVNLVDADIAMITSIAFDHQSWLGDTLEAIAQEKAGILRKGKPLISGLPAPLLNSVADAVSCKKCPYYGKPHLEALQVEKGSWNMRGQFVITEKTLQSQEDYWFLEDLPIPNIPLDNAMLGLQAWYLLAHQFSVLKWSVTDIRSILEQVQIPGRWQRVKDPIPIFLDVGHNVQAAEYLKQKILEFKHQSGIRRVISVFGVMGDKDIEGLVQTLAPAVDLWLPLSLSIDRSATLPQILDVLLKADMAIGDAMLDLKSDWPSVKKNLDPAVDMVVFWGSFHVVAEILPML